MNRKSINGSGDGFAGRRSKSVVFNDLIAELGRDGLDDAVVIELVTELRRKYPCNKAINKLSDALCLKATPEKNMKNPVREEDGLNACVEKNDQNTQEEIIITSESGDIETVMNIEKCLSSDFCKSVSKAAHGSKDDEWTIWVS